MRRNKDKLRALLTRLETRRRLARTLAEMLIEREREQDLLGSMRDPLEGRQ